MYSSIERVHTTSGTRRRTAINAQLEKPAPSPVAEHSKLPLSTCAISIPSINCAVPKKFVIRHDVKKTTLALITFLDLGLVSEIDLEEPWETEAVVLGRAFNRFIEQESSGLALYNPAIVLTDSLSDDGSSNDFDAGDNILFSFYSKSREYLLIGESAESIENAYPGLGETLMYQIGRAVYATLDCATPQSCLDLAKYSYWQGEDDEKMVIEECLAEGESPEDVEMYRRSDYFAKLPEWAADPKQKLSPAQLRKIIRTSDGLACEAAKAALELSQQLIDGYRGPYFGEFIGDNIDPALFVRWSEEDDVERVYDDYYYHATQSDCTDSHGYYSVQPDKEGIGKALEDIRQFFRILRALDTAFSLIGKRIDGEG